MNRLQTSKKYLINQIESASPGTLVLMLFDGAIKYLNISNDQISRTLYNDAFKNKTKAQNIIYELLSCLNMEADSDNLAQNLYQLYDYMLDKLINVEMTKSIQAQEDMDEVITMLKELRSAWKDMIETYN